MSKLSHPTLTSQSGRRHMYTNVKKITLFFAEKNYKGEFPSFINTEQLWWYSKEVLEKSNINTISHLFCFNPLIRMQQQGCIMIAYLPWHVVGSRVTFCTAEVTEVLLNLHLGIFLDTESSIQ